LNPIRPKQRWSNCSTWSLASTTRAVWPLRPVVVCFIGWSLLVARNVEEDLPWATLDQPKSLL
jgi:hypothetical protein